MRDVHGMRWLLMAGPQCPRHQEDQNRGDPAQVDLSRKPVLDFICQSRQSY